MTGKYAPFEETTWDNKYKEFKRGEAPLFNIILPSP